MNNLHPYTFYFDLPIYTPIIISKENLKDFNSLINFNGNINAYNPSLKENTTYSVSSNVLNFNGLDYFFSFGGVLSKQLTCVRTKEAFHFFLQLNKQKSIFQKIGQYPSIADFHISQIKKYDKVLSKEKLKEFSRAIGLAANGVGIGSFVYLRRIFEGLIEEAHSKAKSTPNWNEDSFSKERMTEKIEMLNEFLPSFLVENKQIYSILSVGIHSLKEEECLAYFETVKVGIELILDEKVDIYQKQKKIDDAKSKIANLTGQLKK